MKKITNTHCTFVWPKVIFVIFALFSICSAWGQQNVIAEDQLPLFDLDEVEVLYSPTDFAPTFAEDSPEMSYYDVPALPHGDLVLALEFMDRYRETQVPGSVKWSGMLYMPVIDGEERPWLKWLCLYYYNDKMYGYDPTPQMSYNQRFLVPIQYEDRKNPEVLYRFAANWVEIAFPEWEEEYYLYELDDPTDPDSFGQEIIETIFIPAGRIEGFLSSHKDRDPKDLVRLIYEYSEMPNQGAGTASQYGEAKNVGKSQFTWDSFIKGITEYEDYIDQAAVLLKPRWTQRVRFHYEKGFLFWDINARSRGLLFNIGTKVFIYSPRWGVWRTSATIYDLDYPETLHTKLHYPGVEEVIRVEFINKEVKDIPAAK